MNNTPEHNDTGFYEFDLDIQLENTIDLYEQDREKYWSNQDQIDSKTLYVQVERFADAIIQATERLVTNEGVPSNHSSVSADRKRFLDEIRSVIDLPISVRNNLPPPAAYSLELSKRPELSSPELRLLWERLVVWLAWDSIGTIRDGAVRAMQIWNVVLQSEPSAPTLSFLRHVSKCYVWGFDSECVILCRGVLDSAFRDAVPDELCEKHYPRKDALDDFGLAKRIVVARKEGKIGENIKKLAFHVKEYGDNAVHYDPTAAQNALQTLCDTVRILTELTT
jgi:hypothetical protein